MSSSVSSRDLQKARQIAKRNRTSVACNRCKAAKTKCSEYRPCKKCSVSNAAQSCVQGSQGKPVIQVESFPGPCNTVLDASHAPTVWQSRSGARTESRNVSTSTLPEEAIQCPHPGPSTSISPPAHLEQPFHPSFAPSLDPAHFLHNRSLTLNTETAPWIPYAPAHTPIDTHAAQAVLSSRIGMPLLSPALQPLRALPSSAPFVPPPPPAGLPPAVAALLGLPAAPTPDALRLLLLAAAAAGAGPGSRR